MTDETKKLFDAPWTIEEEAPLAWYCVIDSKDSVVANDVRDQKTVKRLARLPELYEALNKQTYYRCVDCLRHTAKSIDDIPLNKDIIESGCPKHRQDCGAFDVWQLLRKVRDGE